MQRSTVRTMTAFLTAIAIGALLWGPAASRSDAEGLVEAQWSARAPLPEQRTEVSVATDGERIYLAGGFGPPAAGEPAPRTVWAYTPAGDSWEAIGELPEGLNHAAMAYHSGQLFVLGGFREATFEPIAEVRILNLGSGEWRDGEPMPTPRGAAGFTVLNGRIHVVGGNVPSPEVVAGMPDVIVTEDRSVNVHEAYDPKADTWTTLAPMPTPRNHLAAAALDGRIHAVLGRADGDFTFATHEIYDPETDVWEKGPPVPTGRSGVAAVAHDGYLYTFGGEDFANDGRTFDEAERFDPAANEWQSLPPMPTARHGLGAASHDTGIYVISGGPQAGFSFGDMNERLTVEP